MKANCFPCNRASLEEALEVAAVLPAHFRAFPLLAPRMLHLPPSPATGRCSLGVAWVRGCGVGRCGPAGPALCCSCSVMSGCYRSGSLVPVRAGHWRPPGAPRLAIPAGRKPLPRLCSWARVGPSFCTPRTQNPSTHSQAPPESWHLSGVRGRENYIKEDEFYPVLPILYLRPGFGT